MWGKSDIKNFAYKTGGNDEFKKTYFPWYLFCVDREMNTYFLEALKASLKNEKVDWNDEHRCEMQLTDWQDMFRLADTHKVMPLIYEAVYSCPAAKKLNPEFLAPFKKRTVHEVMRQTIKTNEFLALNQHLREAGIRPLVVKGLICRSLYPRPDYRQSGDEDILVPEEQFEKCHEVLLSYGMQPVDARQDISSAHEISYRKCGSLLYIELHKTLFPPEAEAYGEWNHYFKQVHKRPLELSVQDETILTMNHTDHMFYLICHAFKHFLHSGFGIRQVCDINMYANTYGNHIDWQKVLVQCREIRAEKFTAALFRIGENYLGFPQALVCMREECRPEEWGDIHVDEVPLLLDLLSGGIYGSADMSRKHSSNITLGAVVSRKKGNKFDTSLIRTVFPAAKKLESRYPCLKKRPYLLPIMWIDRMVKYGKETKKTAGNDAAESIKIGNRRIELMKNYGIID